MPGVIAAWSTARVERFARDLAYFLGTCLSLEDRRAHEHDLVGAMAMTGRWCAAIRDHRTLALVAN